MKQISVAPHLVSKSIAKPRAPRANHTKAHLAQTLARAFAADPMMNFVFPEDEVRERVLPWFLGATVSYSQKYGEVSASPNGDAVACWLTPGNTTVTTARIFKTGGGLTPLKLGFQRFQRLMALQTHLHKEHAANAPEPHYYLYLLGVDPASWGQGLGRDLMNKMLARADREKKPCYLETQNEKNVAVYRSVGFEVTSSSQLAGHDLHVWTMKRRPDTAGGYHTGSFRRPSS